MRKTWIDLGIRIEFDRIDVTPRQKPPIDGAYCALGRICYPEEGAKEDTLVYVKPGYHGSEPADIRSYAALHEEFPHESTADQWFSESQMESYRALGSHIIGKMCHSHGEIALHSRDEDFAPLRIDEFISSVREYLESTRPHLAAGERPADPTLATGSSADSL